MDMRDTTLPLVSVGIPTYNRPEGLRRTLECITSQTYANLEIIVSDNCSPDPKVKQIAHEFQEENSCVRFYRQEENKGVLFNFEFVLKQSQGKYFMWAADDDEWETQFVESCVSRLEDTPDADVAFCNITCIDSFGRIIRDIPSFKPFASEDRYASIASYILDPEFLGKANLIYSVYKTASFKDYFLQFLSSNSVSNPYADMSCMLGVLCRSRILIDDRVLFKKRLVRQTDKSEKLDSVPTGLPYISGCSKEDQDLYFNDMRIFSANTPYAELVECLLQYRENLNRDLLSMQRAELDKIQTNSSAFSPPDIGRKNRMFQKIVNQLKLLGACK
jgi:glycosyltransferase involved in cell wall biosynthesis